MRKLVLLLNSVPLFLTILYSIGTLFFGTIMFSAFYLIALPLISTILNIYYLRLYNKDQLIKIFLIVNIIIFIFWLVLSIIFCSVYVNGFDKMSFWMKLYVILDLDKLIHNY